MTKYNQTDAAAALNRYKGNNEKTLSDLDALLTVDDAERGVVVDCVSILASRIPNCGPIVALEIVGALARWMAKEEAKRVAVKSLLDSRPAT